MDKFADPCPSPRDEDAVVLAMRVIGHGTCCPGKGWWCRPSPNASPIPALISRRGSGMTVEHLSASGTMYGNQMIDDSNDPERPAGQPVATDTASDICNEPGGVLHLTVHHALLAALCQFIPIPFLDDVAGDRVVRRLVDKLLDRNGRSFGAEAVAPLYEGPSQGVMGRVGGFAKGLIMKPVKKVLRTALIVVTIRRALMTAAQVVLLGRTIDRCLARGELADDAPADRRRERAAQIDAAVRDVMASPERRGLLKLVRESASLLRNDEPAPSVTAAVDADAAEASLSPNERRRLERASAELESKLQSEEQRGMLAALDAAVDARLNAMA